MCKMHCARDFSVEQSYSGFHTGFFVGGGGGELFRNIKIDKKHTFLGESGGIPAISK